MVLILSEKCLFNKSAIISTRESNEVIVTSLGYFLKDQIVPNYKIKLNYRNINANDNSSLKKLKL